MQAFYEMRPPNDVQIARITKILIWRPSVKLVVDGNHKTQLILLAG
jgi:hypothetical protein